jgi:CheY-like chemotaxis protein
VTSASELLQRTLGELVAIESVLGAGLWWVQVDPGELENALLNLAVNARDAMPEGGKLSIETANTYLDEAYVAAQGELAPGQYVMVVVSDTGAGMSNEVVARAFEPFFTTKPSGQGTGLGLSQVYGFIKQSGGHVKIYSELGEGTSVKLYLPRLATGPGQGEGAEESRAVPVSLHSETVLVVEDDDDVRAHSVEILRELGYRVIAAPDGPSALRALEANTDVRLLFTDVGLPGGLDGRQLADAAHRKRPALRVLFTSGYAQNAIVHNSKLDPGVDLVTKPFTYAGLAMKIRKVLTRPER